MSFQEWWYLLNQDLSDIGEPAAALHEAQAHYAAPTAKAARRITEGRAEPYVARIRMGLD